MKKTILASASPRRRELLHMLGFPFEVKVSEAEEIITSRNPQKVTEELSCQKAEAVAGDVTDAVIIGADTVVSIDEKILGKPQNIDEARKMIRLLQGRSHEVYTGVTIIVKTEGKQYIETFSEKTEVKVAAMSDVEIEEYVAGNEAYDKAGGYGIQGTFSKFIEGIEGDYFNVVGLPVHQLYQRLKKILKM